MRLWVLVVVILFDRGGTRSPGASKKGLETWQRDNDDREGHLDHTKYICKRLLAEFIFDLCISSKEVGDLQTRFSWPVPIFKLANRTMPEMMVSAPRANVSVTPPEALRIPLTSKMTGIAYATR
jgi:hypothetical protein